MPKKKLLIIVCNHLDLAWRRCFTRKIECNGEYYIPYAAIQAFEVQYTVTLYKGLERVDFQSHVRWDDFNHRLRVALPINGEGQQIYEIPYGVLKRENYEPSFYWAGSNGDWPAINWAGIETEHFSAALLNKGLPSYKMEKSEINGQTLFLSVLRSPCIPTYLHEPEAYSMTKWDKMPIPARC